MDGIMVWRLVEYICGMGTFLISFFSMFDTYINMRSGVNANSSYERRDGVDDHILVSLGRE